MSEQARRRPNLVLGRSGPDGGDWLAGALARHPEITCLPEGAETEVNPVLDVFPGAGPLATTATNPDFDDAFQALGARAPSGGKWLLWQARNALLLPQLPFVLRESLPDARLLFCLRDPVALVRDLWRDAPPGEQLGSSLSDAASRCRDAMIEASRFDRRSDWTQHFEELPLRETLIEHGMYGPTLARFVRLLGRDRVLAIPAQRFRAQPGEALEAVLRFLGLSGGAELAESVPPFPEALLTPPGREERAALAGWFTKSDRQLSELFGWSAAPWA